MTLAVQGVADALAVLRQEQVQWTRNALYRLRDAKFDALIRHAGTFEGGWFLGETLAFSPIGDAAQPLGAAADDLMRTLDDHAQWLSQIEKAIGLAAEFADFGPLVEPCAVIDLDKGRIAVRAPVAPRFEPPKLQMLSPGFVVARLQLNEAERLGSGDMLILERGPWPMIGDHSTLSRVSLGLDPVTGAIGPLAPGSGADIRPRASSNNSAIASPEPIAMTQPHELSGLNVSVALHLPDRVLTTDELSAMMGRGAFDIGAIGEGLSVTLSIGGRTIGSGDIVRLGDRFAVLLDGAEDAAFAPSEDTAEPDETAGPDVQTAKADTE